MPSIGRCASWIAIALVFASLLDSRMLLAEDKKLTPDALIAQHLLSIGPSERLSQIKSREVVGSAKVRFSQGALGELSGMGRFASDARRVGIILKYNGQDYRGEHFAFDGNDVTVGRFLPGKISVLAEFINRFGGIMKEGLMGGVLSVAWPLYRAEAIRPRLKYDKAKIAGRQVHALEYGAKGGLRDFKIVLFFDPETFHHIRTEYKLHISAAISGGSATGIGVEKADSYYVLSEDFDDFRDVDTLKLPHRYTIGFSSEGQTRSFVAYWTLEAETIVHNSQIDPSVFRAPEY